MSIQPTGRFLIESAVSPASAPAGLESISAPRDGEPGMLRAAMAHTREHPWDQAHRFLADGSRSGLESVSPTFVEPELSQAFPYSSGAGTLESGLHRAVCQYVPPNSFWPWPDRGFGWHLHDDYSGLRAARELAGKPTGKPVRIVILDTGYDPNHVSVPRGLANQQLHRNFVEGGKDATDPGRHFPGSNPGHGTATMALLAGGRVQPSQSPFNDDLGGAPNAEVVPVRIASSVIHFYSGSMTEGIEYAAEIHADVVSISMGGIPSRSWARAVNRAYDAGVAIFAAAGNRFGHSPPASIIYPARFGRVVAVCGATANKDAYYRDGLHFQMQGCFGPTSKMSTSIAAYTPNMPWANMCCEKLITDDGNGTSSATPQAAAAAALWLQHALRPQGVEPWRKVEAVRHALFTSADKSPPDRVKYFGQGLLRARHALDRPFDLSLPQTPRDTVSFPWLRLLGLLENVVEPEGHDAMYEVEALQIFEQSLDLQKIAGGADPHHDELDTATHRALITAMQVSPRASQALRTHLNDLKKEL